MPIDSRIALGIQAPQIENPLDAYSKIAQVQDFQNKNRLAQLTLGEKQREVDDTNTFRTVYKNSMDADGNLIPNKLYAGLAQSGLADKILPLQKADAELQQSRATTGKSLADAEKAKQETAAHQFELAGQIAGSWATDPTVSKDKIIAGLQSAAHAGIIPAQIAQGKVAELQGIGDDPASLQGWAKNTLAQVMKAKEAMSFITPDANAKLSSETSITTTKMNNDTSRVTNAATNATSRRNADLVDARQREQGQAPQYMETDQGLVMLPKKLAPGQVPVGTPVASADGTPLGKPLKDIPASVNTAIVANSQNLKKAQAALALLEGKSVGQAKGDAAATGIKGYLPNALLNRIDPSGTDTRATIADLGSLVLHDRSGAAVTAAESPRLMPFIPLVTDDAATAAKKLRRFIDIYQQENNALGETYSKAQGYKPNPVLERGATSAPAVGNVVNFGDLK